MIIIFGISFEMFMQHQFVILPIFLMQQNHSCWAPYKYKIKTAKCANNQQTQLQILKSHAINVFNEVSSSFIDFNQ